MVWLELKWLKLGFIVASVLMTAENYVHDIRFRVHFQGTNVLFLASFARFELLPGTQLQLLQIALSLVCLIGTSCKSHGFIFQVF